MHCENFRAEKCLYLSFLLYPGLIIKSFLLLEEQFSFVSGRSLEAVTWDKLEKLAHEVGSVGLAGAS